MVFDPEIVAESFAFDASAVADLRTRWGTLIDLCVWGELKASKIGALPRLRKRVLEVGEHMRSLFSDRAWVPVPRERVKGAMAASLNLRDSLLNLERSAKLIEGGADFTVFEEAMLSFRRDLLAVMERHERQWGDLLEAQYDETGDEEDDNTPQSNGPGD
ncbi:MAG TPA: hypothetical protein VKA50_09120 [Gammaproteobacteria bacterium]|nr:hypothetical protein [Gammaproteobacteria bacterium]